MDVLAFWVWGKCHFCLGTSVVVSDSLERVCMNLSLSLVHGLVTCVVDFGQVCLS